ncbi:MAG: nucleoside hydrolase [Actinomycetota bacterium]|jgi:purine nucleosidase
MAPTRVIIDTDPGVDDAVAIMLALASPELEVLALTTVVGNVELEKTTLNARRLLTLAGRSDVLVGRGCATPIGGASGTAAEVHGQDGLGDLAWPEPSVQESSEDAIEMIYRLAQEAPLTLVAIGPLTNIATLLQKHPDVVTSIERVVIMGGASFEGNVTAAAEFNIWVDPEAAEIVFAGAWKLDIMPLDLTHQAFLNDDDLNFLRGLDSEVGDRLAAMLEPYAKFHEEWVGNRDLIMHDAMAVYEVIDPTAIQKDGVKADVETSGVHSRGATWFTRSFHHAESSTRVGVAVHNASFVKLLRERLATYPAKN